MAEQARTLAFVHGSQFSSPVLEEYAARLTEFTGLTDYRLWAVSGGSEATESAIKLARQVQVERGQPGALQDRDPAAQLPRSQPGQPGGQRHGRAARTLHPADERERLAENAQTRFSLSGEADAERLRAVLERQGPETVAVSWPAGGGASDWRSPNAGNSCACQICDESGGAQRRS